jgi:hypothetical protein
VTGFDLWVAGPAGTDREVAEGRSEPTEVEQLDGAPVSLPLVSL